jgi:hypothetical protein
LRGLVDAHLILVDAQPAPALPAGRTAGGNLNSATPSWLPPPGRAWGGEARVDFCKYERYAHTVIIFDGVGVPGMPANTPRKGGPHETAHAAHHRESHLPVL